MVTVMVSLPVLTITITTILWMDYTQSWITPQTFEIETTFVALKWTQSVSDSPWTILSFFGGLVADDGDGEAKDMITVKDIFVWDFSMIPPLLEDFSHFKKCDGLQLFKEIFRDLRQCDDGLNLMLV